MLANNFIVTYITSRNCFLGLSEANMKKMSFQKIVKMNIDSKELYFSCVVTNDVSDSYIGIPSLYAKNLGIVEHQTVYISDVLRLPTLNLIKVSPATADDFEILELSTETIQSNLLDQIRVVNKGQKLTIWISKWLHISIKIDDIEPTTFGCLANLTEVHVAPPQKTNEIQTEITTNENIQTKNEIFEDCAELRRLKKYLTIKKPEVFRVVPLVSPQTKDDQILTHPFNVFMFKKNLPKFLSSNSKKELILCKVNKIDPPVDFRDVKEEHNLKNFLIVRVCVIEDFYDSFSDDTKSFFAVINKFPTIFFPEIIMTLFDLQIGSKIILGNSFDFQSDVRSVEIFSNDKKNGNLVQKLKTFIASHVKQSKLLLNSDVFFELDSNVFCSLKFNPPSDFYLFDELALRNLKFYENSEKSFNFFKTDLNLKLLKVNEIEINYLKSIFKQSEKLLTMKNRNENILIVGKSGSGKSTVAQKIAQILMQKPYFIYVVVISCKKLKGKSVENLHKFFAQDFQNLVYYQPSLLLLDDLHIICGRSETGSEIQTQESLYHNKVSEMLSELIETYQKLHKISVIATTESTIKLNENILSSRGRHVFKNIFNIQELNKNDRIIILKNLFSQKAINDDEIDYDELSIKCENYVFQDFVDFVNRTIFESCKRNVDDKKPIKVNNSDVETVFLNNTALALKDVKLHSGGEKDFRDVGGLESVKKVLVEALNWPSLYPDLFNEAPLRLQSGILLFGPPGVGKTLIVAAVAKQFSLRLISIKGPELLSKYIGASEQGVRNIFEKAQSARPCILFFDEFDSLAPRRGHDSTGVTDRVVNQLLTQLDGVETLKGVFVIAATSRPDLLDPALLRPGRLDRQILCPVPDQPSRLSILEALSRNLNFTKDVDLKKISCATKGFSGADLQAVLYTAQLFAVEDAIRSNQNIEENVVLINPQHLEDSLKGTGPSLTKQETAKYDKIYTKFQNRKEEMDTSIKKQKTTLA